MKKFVTVLICLTVVLIALKSVPARAETQAATGIAYGYSNEKSDIENDAATSAEANCRAAGGYVPFFQLYQYTVVSESNCHEQSFGTLCNVTIQCNIECER